MARPKPRTLIAHVAADRTETSVNAADGIWVVCYRGEPISVRRGPENNAYPGYKYLKSAWPHSGHAFNMADHLNELFDTTDFAVWQMKPHRQIVEPEPKPPKEYNRNWQPTRFSADEIVPVKGKKPGPLR
jgi:hypothetical protein